MIFWYTVALLIILAWIGVMMLLNASRYKEPFEKKGFQLAGPFILWKTQWGKRLIERVARKERPVKLYGQISVWITGISMVTMTLFLFLSAYLVIERARYLKLEPHMLLGLPGLNPLIPLWYGIFALVVAMIVHEFSHGILSALAKVKIVSLGLLFFIFPMGAFVEPDEKELKKVQKRKRVRMYASGPAANIIVAGICSIIFSMVMMSSVHPVADGAGITNVADGSPAEIVGLESGMIMVSFNGLPVDESSDFSRFIGNTRAGDTAWIGIYDADSPNGVRYFDAILDDKSDYTEEGSDAGMGYLGVGSMTVTTAHFHPLGGADEQGGYIRSISMYMVLPLQGLSPVSGSVADFYEITGFWSFLPSSLFWIIANAFYWLFWLNLMVGLTNALPAIPLDGGYIFKDWLDTYVRRRRSKKHKARVRRLKRITFEKIETEGLSQSEAEEEYEGNLKRLMKKEKKVRTKIVDRVCISLALAILFLILWQVIGPRVL